MRQATLILAIVFSAPPLLAQGRNEDTFYNKAKTNFATRATTDEVDTIFFTQPELFRRNSTEGSGWRIVVQDQDRSTVERVTLSWHRLDKRRRKPKKTPITAATFDLFGSGRGAVAFIYTLTTARPTRVPEHLALGCVLPKPRKWTGPFPEDAATLHYQRGDRTKVAPQLRQQWTYKLGESDDVEAEWVIGSTFRWGGLYKGPVLQVFADSNAYGAGREKLFGPESIFPDPTRGDGLGFRLVADEFPTTTLPSVAVVFFSPAYRRAPLPTPIGILFLDERTTSPLNGAVVLDRRGEGSFGPFPLPNLRFEVVWQAGFANFVNHAIRLSNGAKTRL